MTQQATKNDCARCNTCRHRGDVVVFAGGKDPALFRCMRDNTLVTLTSTCTEHDDAR